MISKRVAAALLPLVVPVAAWWVRSREREGLARGVALDPSQMADARRAGVRHPDRVRLWKVDAIPLFHHPLCARFLPDVFAHAIGLTLRYAILIRAEFWGDRHLIAHELAHVAQYERLGGIAAFLRRYFRECLLDGYPESALEREAVAFAAQLR